MQNESNSYYARHALLPPSPYDTCICVSARAGLWSSDLGPVLPVQSYHMTMGATIVDAACSSACVLFRLRARTPPLGAAHLSLPFFRIVRTEPFRRTYVARAVHTPLAIFLLTFDRSVIAEVDPIASSSTKIRRLTRDRAVENLASREDLTWNGLYVFETAGSMATTFVQSLPLYM